MADFKLDNISSFIDENNSNDNTYLSDFFELETNPKLNLHGKDNNVDTMKRILKQKEVNRNVDEDGEVTNPEIVDTFNTILNDAIIDRVLSIKFRSSSFFQRYYIDLIIISLASVSFWESLISNFQYLANPISKF